MDRQKRLRNADFLQMAAHHLEQGDAVGAREAIYDVVSELHASEFDREANTLMGAAMHTKFGRFGRAQHYVGEVYERLVDGHHSATSGGLDRKI